MKKRITTMAAALVAASVAHADVLAAWDMSGNDGKSSTQAVTTVSSGMSAGDLTLGPGLPGGGVGWPDVVASYADWQISSSLEYALGAGNDYFTFTVAPAAGKTASYSDVFTRFVVNAGSADASINFALFSDKTGFTTNDMLGSINVTTLQADEGYVPSVHEKDFDVSGVAALQNVGTATEFRVYVWKDYGGNRLGIGKTWSGATGDDVVVNGSVIPEPGTLGLFGLAAAGMFWFRKRF